MILTIKSQQLVTFDLILPMKTEFLVRGSFYFNFLGGLIYRGVFPSTASIIRPLQLHFSIRISLCVMRTSV